MKKIFMLVIMPIYFLKAQTSCDTIIMKSNVESRDLIYSPVFKSGDSVLVKIIIDNISPCLKSINANDSSVRFITLNFEVNKKGTINRKLFFVESSQTFISCLDSNKKRMLYELSNWFPAKKNGKITTSVLSLYIWIKQNKISMNLIDVINRRDLLIYHFDIKGRGNVFIQR